MNVPTTTHDSHNRSWLFGVPKKVATLRWRIVYRRDAMNRRSVPEHLRSAGMYCPSCGKGQPFSGQCAFCRCDFPCFVVVRTSTVANLKKPSNAAVSPGTEKQGTSHGYLAPLQAAFVRLGTASMRVRVLAICVMVLLPVSLAVGISHYRSNLQKHYSQRFVLALYGIKSGINLSGMVCEGTYKHWKEGVPLQPSASGKVDSQAIADLVAVKTEVDGIMGKMGAPPATYDQSARTLLRLYAIYDELNSKIINSPDSLSRQQTGIVKARNDFAREIGELKVNWPAPLAEEFKIASQKYDLQFMALGK